MQQQGFILPMVLIFLMIFTLLGVSALTLSQLQMRMSHNSQSAAIDLQSAESGLREAEQQLEKTDPINCLIPLQFKPWQASQTCSFSGGQYVIEHLSQNPANCIITENKQFLADYYRITAWNQSRIVQSTFIKKGVDSPIKCRSVSEGRASWREINLF